VCVCVSAPLFLCVPLLLLLLLFSLIMSARVLPMLTHTHTHTHTHTRTNTHTVLLNYCFISLCLSRFALILLLRAHSIMFIIFTSAPALPLFALSCSRPRSPPVSCPWCSLLPPPLQCCLRVTTVLLTRHCSVVSIVLQCICSAVTS
jgi:hypothetical protein